MRVIFETRVWNGREFHSAHCTCGYNANFNLDRAKVEKLASAHLAKHQKEAK